jgi:hypothetical protein
VLLDEVVQVVENLALAFGERLHGWPPISGRPELIALCRRSSSRGESERNTQESIKQKAKVNAG